MKTIKNILLAMVLLMLSTQIKAQENTGIDNTLNAYLGVKNALAADNSALAQLKAKELLNVMSVGHSDQLNSSQQIVWNAYADKLLFDARHISESSAIAHQREHFSVLSKNMFAFIKALKLNTMAVYEQYCPMKKVTWLSETAVIKNPYYGKLMLGCGKTVETLAPEK